MAKMLVIYKTPADPAAFDRHYFEVHIPLAKKLPGLRRYDVSRRPMIKLSAGEMPYLVGTLYFDSLDDIRAAFASEIGAACAVDRRILAGRRRSDDAAVRRRRSVTPASRHTPETRFNIREKLAKRSSAITIPWRPDSARRTTPRSLQCNDV
ncbi:EthD family reductase [Mesorhizobium sp. ES1-4]|nr:EthD family reductase [Mesorhizobium sp. ES1-4]MBZ9797602.1 EthD family reductase [Mesorhizobium sp. ES1-4]